MDRRHFLKSTIATSALAAAGTVASPSVTRAQPGPIKIGLMAPLTGVVAAGGREMVDGFNMFWEQVGNVVAGRKVEVVVEDDAAIQFARTVGLVPAPESSHAVKAAIDEALAAKAAGQKRVILFNLSGHGLMDMTAYDAYLTGHTL